MSKVAIEKFIQSQLDEMRIKLSYEIRKLIQDFGKKPYNQKFTQRNSLNYSYIKFLESYYETEITQEYFPMRYIYPEHKEYYQITFGKSKEQQIREHEREIKRLKTN